MRWPGNTCGLRSEPLAGLLLAEARKRPMPDTRPAARNALPGPDDITREVLPNGIVVLARENFTTPSVVISGAIQVGSLFETAEKAGLSNFVSASLMRGTTHRDFDTIHETLEGIGASLGIGAGGHTTSLNGTSLAEAPPALL